MRKKASKSRTRSKVKVKDLAPKDIKAVKGGVGRKSGEGYKD